MILVLDDDVQRLDGFRQCHPVFGCELRTWSSAPRMIAEVERWLSAAQLISLDHDLYKFHELDADPGTGRMVADFLAQCPPVCPVIVHSTNTDAAWGMHNVLSRARWSVEIVHHLNELDWIAQRWVPAARRLLDTARAAAAARQVLMQAGVLAYRRSGDDIEVLLVGRKGTTKWSIPKGGLEPGLSAPESAYREAWEEAGIGGVVDTSPLGRYRYAKDGADATVTVFAMSVVVHHDYWPESPERERRWFTPAEALSALDDPALAPLMDTLLARLAR